MDELAEMDEGRRAQVMQAMQIQPNDPRLEQIVRTKNDITSMDVDISIEEGIDIPSIQAEQFQTLVQLAGIQPGLIPGDVLIAASGLKNKDQLLERMKAHAEQQQQQQQQQAPLIQAHAEATVAKLQGDAAASKALALERTHNTINTIADTHQIHQNLLAPPDPPSAPGTAGEPPMPPAMQAMHDAADLAGKHAKVEVDMAKANDLMHAAVHKVAQVHQMHHTMLHPPEPKGTAK
jgi:hypothetical protein